VIGTHTPSSTATIVSEFLAAEMPGSVTTLDTMATLGTPPRQDVRLAAIGTTAAKPLKSPQLRSALEAVGLDVASATPFADAPSLIDGDGWDIGIVLSPFKLVTAGLVDELSPSAQLTGVVDTAFTRAGRTYGVNSNTWAVLAVLRRLIGTTPPKRVLVLGSGGSTRSVLLAVQRAWPGADCVVSARDPVKAAPIAERFGVQVAEPARIAELRADVVVNTTTWGETAESENVPFAFDLDAALRPGAAYFDLNNRRSSLVERALDRGCVVMSGTFMQRVTHDCRAAGLRRWIDTDEQ
jgi:shikimate dehydrogenase